VADPPKPRTTTAESTAANSRAAIGAMARVTSPGGATHIAARTPATIAIPAATYGSGSPHEPATRPATSIAEVSARTTGAVGVTAERTPPSANPAPNAAAAMTASELAMTSSSTASRSAPAATQPQTAAGQPRNRYGAQIANAAPVSR